MILFSSSWLRRASACDWLALGSRPLARRLGAVVASIGSAVLLAGGASAQTYPYTLYATSVPAVSGWDFEDQATGAPGGDECNTTGGPYATNFQDTNNHTWLKATAFQSFSLPAQQVITSVRVSAHARYDDNTTSRLGCRVDLPGVYSTGDQLTANFASSTSCAWRDFGVELNDVVHFNLAPNPTALLALIDLSVNRPDIASANGNRLRVKAFRIDIIAKQDSDGDRVPDESDGCPFDPTKTQPGVCGCGTPDTDSDGDGAPDCVDGCPADPNKTQPGVCDCGTPDTDSDGDGVPDCIDSCAFDPFKIQPGVCGCGVSDVDSDGDGVPNCIDGCPNDPAKVQPGVCGCGVSDVDSDGDGVPNCNDGCPQDPAKVQPGVCGCGTPDTDSDGDGVPNCNDNCMHLYNPTQADCDYDGVGDVCELAAGTQVDINGNSIPDSCEGAFTYCTAGSSTNGCTPSMSTLGTPSVSQPWGYFLRCGGLEGKKSSLIFYGVSGAQVVLFDSNSTSLFCVKAPVQRVAFLNSGGAVGQCNGAVQTDILQFWSQNPSALGAPFSPGATVNAQTWYRDPPAPKASNLSNALQFVTVP